MPEPSPTCTLTATAASDELLLRLAERASFSAGPGIKPSSRVFCSGIPPRMDAPVLIPEPGAYRLKMLSQRPDGEPVFEAVPKWLWKDNEHSTPPPR